MYGKGQGKGIMYLCDEKVREKQNFNLDWYFYHGDNQIQAGQTQVSEYEPVKLPHYFLCFYSFPYLFVENPLKFLSRDFNG